MFFKLAIKSLLNRKGSVALTVMAMTVSVFVLLAVEHIRHQTKESFSSTVSGVDLIVGARTGSLNLLLYSVFKIGAPTNNVSWASYKKIENDPQVSWSVPISLGDSHKGYRVVGTTQDYFSHFSYGKQRKLAFQKGEKFNQLFDVVLGSEVAKKLNYDLGSKIILAHGLASTSFSQHDKYPFTVVGILQPTGTPVDQSLHVSLEGIEAIHLNWQKQGFGASPAQLTPEQLKNIQLTPKSVTAIMLGLKSKMMTFTVQRGINQHKAEPLTAILPGVALSELWQMMAILENTLLLVSVFVFIAALLGLSAMLLSSVKSRENEIRLLRAVGAHPSFLFLLIQLESLVVTSLSLLLGAALLALGLTLAEGFITETFGIVISNNILSEGALIFSLAILIASMIVSALPSIVAYIRAKRI